MAAPRHMGLSALNIGNILRRSVSTICIHNSYSNACGFCTNRAMNTSSTLPRTRRARTDLDYEELRTLMLSGEVQLIDVRHPEELRAYGEIPGSVNIPLCEIKSALQMSEAQWESQFLMPKPAKYERNLVFYARGPNAASTAVEIAHRLGFKSSRRYPGGWEDYCKMTGQPLKKMIPHDVFDSCNHCYQDTTDQFFL
ncbi:thiosulfate:glutathione sulfurtransferase-like isoform X1 [Oratosquilla oratoria]|uniref:thiosulfate:glutathione sulfurtransferase-like isoform X1 n=1 Tax=Oratosquilla oratoria TaxID=337810 RepID=UPI003F767284